MPSPPVTGSVFKSGATLSLEQKVQKIQTELSASTAALSQSIARDNLSKPLMDIIQNYSLQQLYAFKEVVEQKISEEEKKQIPPKI